MTPSEGGSYDLFQKVALSCNVLAHEGQEDLTLGHVSARDPESGSVFMKAAGHGLSEVTAGEVIECDLDGEILKGSGRLHSEYPIHAEIYRARRDVGCVVHTHPPHAVALGSRRETIKAVAHEGVLFHGIPIFQETTALIRDAATGQLLAESLGEYPAALMINHGIVVVGETVEEATVRAVLLEKAAAIQLLAGGEDDTFWSSDEEIELKQRQIYRSANMGAFFAYLVRQLPLASQVALD